MLSVLVNYDIELDIRHYFYDMDWMFGLFAGSLQNAVRQSSRQRVAPLKFWINERILLSPFSGTSRVVSSHSSDMTDIADAV